MHRASPAIESASARYQRYCRAIGQRSLPAGLVDLDALERNLDAVLEVARAHNKRLRIATKSIRCRRLIAHVCERAGDALSGLMAFSAREAAWLAEAGFSDLLLGYPWLHAEELAAVAAANAHAKVVLMADDPAHVLAAAEAARKVGTSIPLCIDIDASWRPLGGSVHLGVRRSPLRSPEQAVQLAQLIEVTPGVCFAGVMAYEAQIAGMADASPYGRWQNPIKRAIRLASRKHVAKLREAVLAALAAAGLKAELVNGGGSGSLPWTASEEAVTEVTVGSALLAGHLFDYYREIAPVPVACYAVPVSRVAAPRIVTCQGGGFVASGESGLDRLPRPYLPEGLQLLPREGAGEVQTPLRLPEGARLELGDLVFLRHAKSGELAEQLNGYLLVRGDQVVEEAPTYRGEGMRF